MEIVLHRELRDGAGHFRLDVALKLHCRRLVLFGPSGSGKSLTLQAVAGLLRPDGGRIRVGERVLFDADANVDVPTRLRRVGYLFQDYALFPHLTLEENLCFGLARFGRPLSAAQRQRVGELLESFALTPQARRRPAELSGGQKQRAALARALAPGPDLLLLDEPFSALDQPLRLRLRQELLLALTRYDTPLILVTHDPAEALEFGEVIAVFDHGRVRHCFKNGDLANEADPAATLREAFAEVTV
ncbi:MAG: hypothetical protein BWK76_23945 [Desulfobulbaceae bacterium A2]|nr:MAG: hypothetical protein BWK76_23945 [Desulfobulbaceae bacterium A2]